MTQDAHKKAASDGEGKDEWLETADADAIFTAAFKLSAGFIYNLTPEGGAYWHGVQTRLEAMAKQARKHSSLLSQSQPPEKAE